MGRVSPCASQSTIPCILKSDAQDRSKRGRSRIPGPNEAVAELDSPRLDRSLPEFEQSKEPTASRSDCARRNSVGTLGGEDGRSWNLRGRGCFERTAGRGGTAERRVFLRGQR